MAAPVACRNAAYRRSLLLAYHTVVITITGGRYLKHWAGVFRERGSGGVRGRVAARGQSFRRYNRGNAGTGFPKCFAALTEQREAVQLAKNAGPGD